MPETGELTGYASSAYAASLAEFGTPRLLPRCDGWLLERPVPGRPYRDAIGCYPLFSCTDWAGLGADIGDLAGDLVAVSLVADPFGAYAPADLRTCFPDKFLPFKAHFVADLRRSPKQYVVRHHRRYARQALRAATVERCEEPGRHLDEWIALYDTLIARHGLRWIKAFSRRAFARQLAIPGMVMFRAQCGGETVGAQLWFIRDDVVYHHLTAMSPRGYELTVSFGLYWSALEAFADEARWMDFGAGAGTGGDGTDGLTSFKRGWASETRTAYLCGRVLDREKYRDSLAASGLPDNEYFPAYRRGEFG